MPGVLARYVERWGWPAILLSLLIGLVIGVVVGMSPDSWW